MRLDKLPYFCAVCGKPKNGVHHAACSRKLQQQNQAKNDATKRKRKLRPASVEFLGGFK